MDDVSGSPASHGQFPNTTDEFNPSNNLEAVTVCVGYSDFLAETLKYNRQHFNRWVIVTHPKDMETIELCRRANLHLVVTDEFGRGGPRPFNKGRGISLGMNFVSSGSWVLHLDADVVLPNQFRQMLDVAHLDPQCIYGADRVLIKNWEEWQLYQKAEWLQNQHGYHLCCNFPATAHVGTRIIRGRHGYVPIGFFQLFHYDNGVHVGHRWKDYPDASDNAAHSDIKFALHWDRRKRILLPEIIVAHLESEQLGMGANWRGRKTKRFGPTPS